MRHLLNSVELAHMIQRIDRRAESAVQAKDRMLHQRRQREVIEQIREHLPNIGASVLSNAFIVEPVHLRDLTTLMIASQDEDAVRVSDLQAHEHRDRFYGVVPSVHVISHEQVVCVRSAAADAKQLHQVVPLAMNVTAHGHRSRHRLHVGFAEERLPGQFAKHLHLAFGERGPHGQLGEPCLQVLVRLFGVHVAVRPSHCGWHGRWRRRRNGALAHRSGVIGVARHRGGRDVCYVVHHGVDDQSIV
mmetsp:Transcript_11852/g.34208  ORF Transcript_11852/g.34208 Transcript_11852/m.34208 type:complete len:246 (+) Transcript_11852:453-1190(+)